MKALTLEKMEQVNGGEVTEIPNGSCDPEDKAVIEMLGGDLGIIQLIRNLAHKCHKC